MSVGDMSRGTVEAVETLLLIMGVAVPGSVILRRWVLARLHRSGGGRGSRGLCQPLFDAVKLLVKRPAQGAVPLSGVQGVGLVAAVLAPLAVLAAVPYSRIPAGGTPGLVHGADLGVGFVLAAIGVEAWVAAALGADARTWAETAAAVRAGESLTGVVVVLGLSLAGLTWGASSMRLGDIVGAQVNREGLIPHWNALWQPAGFACAVAALEIWAQRRPHVAPGRWTNGWPAGGRGPGGPVLAWLEVAGHLRRLAAAVLITALFLGGAHLPWDVRLWGGDGVVGYTGLGVFGLKSLIMLVMLTGLADLLPKLRADQARRLLWRRLMPLACVNLLWVWTVTVWMGRHG